MRVVLLLVAGLSLYLLAPKLIDVFSTWPQLRDIDPVWLGVAIFFEALSYVALWTLQRIALRTRSWFAVGTSQLAAGAAGDGIPGGGAAATAVQYSILVRAGVSPQTVGSGLTASWAATTTTALALPVVAALAAIGATTTPKGLREVAYIGAAAFVVVAGILAAALAWDEPVRLFARGVRAAAGLVHKRERFEELPERLLRERDAVRSAFAARPVVAVLAAVGKWGFDYVALLCVLAALDARPEPALVLLAYSAASLLAMIPLTPGGLGFVEAGLAGMLGLAGVGAATATLATLAYRLVSFLAAPPVRARAPLLPRPPPRPRARRPPPPPPPPPRAAA